MGDDRRREVAVLGVNLGHAVITSGNGDALFPNYFGGRTCPVPSTGAEYCGECFCVYVVYVCLYVCPYTSTSLEPKFKVQQIFCGRGSVLLWRLCDTFCTSGFVDDIRFSYN